MKSFAFVTVQHTGARFFIRVFRAAGYTLKKAGDVTTRLDLVLPDTVYWMHTDNERFDAFMSAFTRAELPLVTTERDSAKVDDRWAYEVARTPRRLTALTEQRRILNQHMGEMAGVLSVDAPDRAKRLRDLGRLLGASFDPGDWTPFKHRER